MTPEARPRSTDAPPRPQGDAWLGRLLGPSVFLSGAVVLVLEVLGSRLIGPVFGTSLYVWSALIAVTLVSLALGYWLGGRLADRRPDARVFYLLFDISAVLIALIPLLRSPVFALARPLGLRSGALVSALLFFALPLTILGMISPFAVRLAARVLDRVGQAAGRLYAISTAGSLAGTLLTGFVLIPHFRVRDIFFASAAALLLPALVYQLLGARRQLAATAAAVLAIVLVAGRAPMASSRVLSVRESFFSQVKIVEGDHFRAMLLNGATQTVTGPDSSLPIMVYPNVMAEMAWRARPEGRRALVVGLGGGVLSPLLSSWGVRSRVVEIDPAVVEEAERYFRFDPASVDLTIADGRQFLATTPETYDYVLLDAFAGEVVPVHLLTREMMRTVAAHLAPDGVVLLNFVGYRSGERSRPVNSIARTIREEFPYLAVFACDTGDYGGNVMIASRAPLRLESREAPLPFPLHPLVAADVRAVRERLPNGPSIVLTDDFNPLDLWALEGQEESRRESLAWLPWDVVLAE